MIELRRDYNIPPRLLRTVRLFVCVSACVVCPCPCAPDRLVIGAKPTFETNVRCDYCAVLSPRSFGQLNNNGMSYRGSPQRRLRSWPRTQAVENV